MIPNNLEAVHGKNAVVIVAGANAVGKGTIVKELIAEPKLNCRMAVRHTTRQMGDGEQDGVNYHFVRDSGPLNREEVFKNLIGQEFFLEWAKYLPGYYGTSKSAVINILNQGSNSILDVDVNAGLAAIDFFKQKKVPHVDFYVIPVARQSLDNLSGRGEYLDKIRLRLKKRNRGFDLDETEINDRLYYASKWLENLGDYNNVVENLDDQLESAVGQILGVMVTHGLLTKTQL